jgi:hypothetical protein
MYTKNESERTVGTDTVSPNVRWKRDDVRWRKEEGRGKMDEMAGVFSFFPYYSMEF